MDSLLDKLKLLYPETFYRLELHTTQYNGYIEVVIEHRVSDRMLMSMNSLDSQLNLLRQSWEIGYPQHYCPVRIDKTMSWEHQSTMFRLMYIFDNLHSFEVAIDEMLWHSFSVTFNKELDNVLQDSV